MYMHMRRFGFKAAVRLVAHSLRIFSMQVQASGAMGFWFVRTTTLIPFTPCLNVSSYMITAFNCVFTEK
jgi:hypothetical protein